MEYANGDTLRNYLKENFNDLTWDDKIKLALQLAHAISCLHDEGIFHHGLVIYLYYDNELSNAIVINYLF